MMKMLKSAVAVFLKDLQSEFRTRYAMNAVLTFTGASLLLVLFTLNAGQLPQDAQAGLVWIIILFAALSSLSRSFVAETERQTFTLLRLHSAAPSVFGGKFMYNFAFTLAVNIVTFVLYLFFLGLPVKSVEGLLLILLLGSIALCSISTFLAAVVSQADQKGAIFSVLCLPLLFPLILVLVDATKAAIFDGITSAFMNNLFAIIGYAGATGTAGFLLFDYIWEE